MINLKVEKIKGNDYKVIGEGIEAEVYYSSRHYNKVSGKGSRKFKNEILEAVENFNRQEAINYKKKQEKEKQVKRSELLDSNIYKNIDLLSLYNVTVSYYDSYHGRWSTYNKFLTGYELKHEDDAVNAEKVSIENTDIYSINSHSQSHYERQAVADERIILMEMGMSKSVFITGLALKEMLLDGFKSYGNLRLVQDVELRMIQQKGLVCPRFQNEVKRALETVGEPKQERQFTNDGKEISYAWFSGKVFSLDGIRNKEMATYDRYVIEKSITVDNDTFEKFGETFEVSDLGVEFKGGTSSTFEIGRDVNDYFELTEKEQANYTMNSYRECLEVVNVETGETLLVDPQGYDYGRYVAIKEYNNSEQEKSLVENEAEEISELVNENIVYNSVSQESLGVNLQHFSTSTTLDDVLSAFDDVDMSENSVITDDDKSYCERQEQSYKKTITTFKEVLKMYNSLVDEFGLESWENENIGYINKYDDIEKIKKRIKEIKDKFISRICSYFKNKYDISIETMEIKEKYDEKITYQNIIDEIIEQLDGFTFVEKAEQEIKNNMKKTAEHSKVKINKNKISISSYVYLDYISERYGSNKISYSSKDKVTSLLRAFEHYNSFDKKSLNVLENTLNYKENDDVFTTHEINLPKIKSIKLFKNGRVDIHFTSSKYAKEFYIDYLQK